MTLVQGVGGKEQRMAEKRARVKVQNHIYNTAGGRMKVYRMNYSTELC